MAERLRGGREALPPAENILEIPMDVPIKPYLGMRRWFWPKHGEKPNQIPEGYNYTLLLRRRVSLHGIEGFIDVIGEDPNSLAQMVVNNGHYDVEKPFGEVAFRMIWGAETETLRDADLDEQPFILRFGFPVRNPAEYAKLLNTYVDVKLERERYMAAWNLSLPAVARRMKRLEEGNPIRLKEKNLFNLKDVEPAAEGDGINEEDFGRITFVWLTPEIRKLRGIEMTFHQFYDNDGEEPDIPPSPEKDLVLAQRELVIARV